MPPRRRCCCVVNVALFSRVTLIRKLQTTSDLDHSHACDLPCSHVKSCDDPISSRAGDSGVLYCFIYKDAVIRHTHLISRYFIRVDGLKVILTFCLLNYINDQSYAICVTLMYTADYRSLRQITFL